MKLNILTKSYHYFIKWIEWDTHVRALFYELYEKNTQ